MATTYHIKVSGAVHTSNLSLNQAVKFATDLDYDAASIRAKLLNNGRAIVSDDVGRMIIEAEQAYARQ